MRSRWQVAGQRKGAEVLSQKVHVLLNPMKVTLPDCRLSFLQKLSLNLLVIILSFFRYSNFSASCQVHPIYLNALPKVKYVRVLVGDLLYSLY